MYLLCMPYDIYSASNAASTDVVAASKHTWMISMVTFMKPRFAKKSAFFRKASKLYKLRFSGHFHSTSLDKQQG